LNILHRNTGDLFLKDIMKNNTLGLAVKEDIANKISYYHILLFLISLPFDRFYSQLILLSFIIHTLLHVKKERLRYSFSRKVIILQSVYFLTIICTLYTINIKGAFLDWDKQLSIFVFPLLFGFTSLDIRKYKLQLLEIFSIACTLTIAYLYIDAFRIIYYKHLPFSTLFSEVFINHNFSQPIGTHATYLSMYVALSLSCLIYLYTKEISQIKKTIFIICCFVLFAGLIQLCSKAVFIAVIFIITVVLPYFLLEGNKRIKFIVITAIISALTLVAIFNTDVLRIRYFTSLQSDLTKVSVTHDESRLLRWNSALKVIKKSPVIGFGTGSEVPVLKDQYFKDKLYQSYVSELNAHNQYLSFLLRSGIIGLLIYLFILGFGFRESVKRKDVIFLSFMILVATVSISENILDVNKGIFFYSFFFSFFLFSE
jgi:O-antigen ligase